MAKLFQNSQEFISHWANEPFEKDLGADTGDEEIVNSIQEKIHRMRSRVS